MSIKLTTLSDFSEIGEGVVCPLWALLSGHADQELEQRHSGIASPIQSTDIFSDLNLDELASFGVLVVFHIETLEL